MQTALRSQWNKSWKNNSLFASPVICRPTVSAASINLGLIPSRPFAQGFMDRLTQGAVQVRLTAEYEGKAVQGIIPIIHKHLDVFEDALREVLSFLHETEI